MPLNTYLGIGKPEEKKEIHNSTDHVKIVEHAFDIWRSRLGNPPECDRLVSEAALLLQPYDNVLPETIDESCFRMLEDVDNYTKKFSALFYTALLSMEKERTLVVPASITDMSFLGYKMKKGVIDMHGQGNSIGYCAEGGYTVNRGVALELGNNARGGFFVNYGYLGDLRQFEDMGQIIRGLGRNSKGGIFIDYSAQRHEWMCAEGMFIFPKIRETQINLYSHKMDNKLRWLTRVLENAKEGDIKDIKAIAMDIEYHCNTYYPYALK